MTGLLGSRWLSWSPATPQGWPQGGRPVGPSSCLSLGGYSDHRLEKWQVAPGEVFRLFPPQYQLWHLLPFPLRHVSLSHTVAWDGEQRKGVAPTYRVARVPITLAAVCQPPAAEGVGWAGQTALSFHWGCWHQAEQRSPGQKPWSLPEHLPDGAALSFGEPSCWQK